NTEHEPPRLSRVDVSNGVVTVALDGAEGEFTFIGQDGDVKQTVDHVSTAHYTLAPTDTYVRTRVKTASHVLFLNPIVRFDGRALPSPVATVEGLWTWIERLGILLFCALLVASIVGRHSRRGGTGVTDALRPWRRVAAWMLVVAACLAAPAHAQDA